MRQGLVVSIRVNPEDCQSVLDVIKASGINIAGVSFSQMVSLTLSSLLETARANNMIERPDPFQFLNRLSPYIGSRNNKRKTAISNVITGIGSEFKAPVLDMPTAAPVMNEVITPEVRAARMELKELVAKKELCEVDHSVIWQQSDQQEYDRLCAIVYG